MYVDDRRFNLHQFGFNVEISHYFLKHRKHIDWRHEYHCVRPAVTDHANECASPLPWMQIFTAPCAL
ncbi:hypothetical protein WI89_07130 [Burkholderia ubonensis]|nr:hypothetical protein WI89_07130 [Burkholderia ubonensis]